MPGDAEHGELGVLMEARMEEWGVFGWGSGDFPWRPGCGGVRSVFGWAHGLLVEVRTLHGEV